MEKIIWVIDDNKKDLVIKNVKEALQGAEDIIAEDVADNARFRKWISY